MPLSPTVLTIVHKAAEALGYDDVKSSEALEGVAAYYALQHAGLDAGDAAAALERLQSGGNADARLDAIAIIVNDRIITPDHDLASLEGELAEKRAADVTFVLVQATGADPANKNTTRLTDKITGFTSGVQGFLFANPKERGVNKVVQGWLSLREELFKLLSKYEIKKNCSLRAYLVWPYDHELRDTHNFDVKAFQRVIMAGMGERMANEPSFNFINRKAFLAIAQHLEVRTECEIEQKWIAPAPAPDGVKMFFGFVPAGHFVEMIKEKIGGKPQVLPQLFQDNVRAYLGERGGVNASIRSTLDSPEERAQFHLRNNGVAIVARESVADRGMYRFRDVQIVNGCQTSYTLFNALTSEPGEKWGDVWVPVRIVVANDETAINELILGLNRQEAISEIQVLSRDPYVIALAQHVAVAGRKNSQNKIWFERRVGEHEKITKQVDKVVSLHDLMFAYGAMFMARPHLDLTPAALRAAHKGGNLLSSRHDPQFYVLAGVTIMRLRQALKARPLISFGRQRPSYAEYGAKNQLLYATRLLADKKVKATLPVDRMGTNATDYLAKIGKVLLNHVEVGKLAGHAIACVEEADGKARDGGRPLVGSLYDRARREAFTRAVEAACDRRSV